MISNNSQVSYRSGNPYDIAEQLGEDGITRLLEIVFESYYLLCAKQSIKLGMSEDDITEELFNEIVFVWSKSNITKTIRPINQKIDRTQAKDKGKPPTIDFCFRDHWVKEVFFGFECKILEEGNSRLYYEYIKNGLFRYLQGKYCAKGSTGSLIGYINSGSLTTIVQDIKTRVDEENILKSMVIAPDIRSFKEHYISIHTREMGLSPFCLHHLFFNFIEKNSIKKTMMNFI